MSSLSLRDFVQHKWNCEREKERQADDSAKYLSVKCTCGLADVLARLPLEGETVRGLADKWRHVSPVAWKAVYTFRGTPISSFHFSHDDAMRVLDEKRGPEYGAHEVVALYDMPPYRCADQLEAASQPAETRWQPIETAPKDATKE